MSRFPATPVSAQSLNLNGIVTAQFPGVAYKRYITRLLSVATGPGTIAIYTGQPNGTQLGGTVANATAQWTPLHDTIIPAGWPLYVLWLSLNPASDSATATLWAEGEL